MHLRTQALVFVCVFLFGVKANATYTGPELKVPMPAGYSWWVNGVPGSYSTHTGDDYYSIDYDDDMAEDGQGDFGEGVVDVLAAAAGSATVHANYGGYGNAVIIVMVVGIPLYMLICTALLFPMVKFLKVMFSESLGIQVILMGLIFISR